MLTSLAQFSLTMLCCKCFSLSIQGLFCAVKTVFFFLIQGFLIMKIHMKKIAVVVLSGCLMLSQPVIAIDIPKASGIPTYDPAAVYQAVQQGIKLKQQIENQISQLRELEAQVKAMSGLRDVGKVARSALDTATGIGSEWAELYGKAKVTGSIKDDLDGKKYSHENNLQQILETQKLNIKSLEEAQHRMENLMDLGQQALQTKDVKAAADFANRIAIADEAGYGRACR